MTVFNKLDMLYEFYIKHTMSALERNLNAMMDKKKKIL